MAPESSLDLGPEQLARLLGVGSDEEIQEQAPGRARGPEVLLSNSLSAPLPLGQVDASTEEREFDVEFPGLRGRTFGEIVTTEDVSAATLIAAKRLAKRLARREPATDKREVFAAIYMSVIARALVLRGRRITRLSRGELRQAFGDLAAAAWVSDDLTKGFLAALEALA